VAHSLPQTTAELLIRASEGVYVLGPETSTDDVSTFLGGSAAHAAPALEGARELGFVAQGQDSDHWIPGPLARLLASVPPAEKTVLLRLQLEQYEPYAVFRDRLLAGESSADAARQTCIKFTFAIDALDAETVLVNWGTYSNGLRYAEDRKLLVTVDPDIDRTIVAVQERVVAERAAIRAHIVARLGVDAAAFATGEIIDRLIDSYFDLVNGDPVRDSVFHLGHALEAFVKKVAEIDPVVVLPATTRTLGGVAQHLRNERRFNDKHHGLIVGLTALRNAADHAADAEVGATWEISRRTAMAANELGWAVMRSFFETRAGRAEL